MRPCCRTSRPVCRSPAAWARPRCRGPRRDGGHDISGYRVTGTGGLNRDLSSTARSTTFSGLQPSTSYTFVVRALNQDSAGADNLVERDRHEVQRPCRGAHREDRDRGHRAASEGELRRSRRQDRAGPAQGVRRNLVDGSQTQDRLERSAFCDAERSQHGRLPPAVPPAGTALMGGTVGAPSTSDEAAARSCRHPLTHWRRGGGSGRLGPAGPAARAGRGRRQAATPRGHPSDERPGARSSRSPA